ncbi:MAG: hypothetical protein ABIU95_09200 [Burkholderiales bacterium]
MRLLSIFIAAAIGNFAAPASATGLATCDSGARANWQPQEKLEKMLAERG